MNLGLRTRIIYDFLVIIQGSYMISLISYKDRTKKSSMDSMKSYMILVWNQRNFNPGLFSVNCNHLLHHVLIVDVLLQVRTVKPHWACGVLIVNLGFFLSSWRGICYSEALCVDLRSVFFERFKSRICTQTSIRSRDVKIVSGLFAQRAAWSD